MKIEIKNISKDINGKKIIKDINWKINSGTLVSIKGNSGSGKTTLLNIISLLDKPTVGKILFDEKEVTNIKLRKKRELFKYNIGFIFQNYGLLENSSVKDNLQMGLRFQKLNNKQKRLKMEAVLEQVNLSLDLSEKVTSLSGGEQQRIGLARCILKNSNLIIADEPTASLDSENENMMMRKFKELKNKGCTIILTTHSEKYNDWFDDIIYL